MKNLLIFSGILFIVLFSNEIVKSQDCSTCFEELDSGNTGLEMDD